MDANELVQKHARERSVLEQKIGQLEQQIKIEPSRLKKRDQEIELENLRGQLAHVKARQAVEPMVRDLLKEVVARKGLRHSKREHLTHTTPYEHERTKEVTEGKWIFKTTRKEIIKETLYKTETELQNVIIDGALEVFQKTPDSWSIMGRAPSPGSCIIMYTITFRGRDFLIQAQSDASWKNEDPKKQIQSESGEIIPPAHMTGKEWSCGVTERELVDSIQKYIISPESWYKVSEVCPCTYSIACVCACACDCFRDAHPFGLYGMPSLWDSPLVESQLEPSQIQVGKPSVYLHTMPADTAVMIYHSLLGNLRYSSPEILDFFSMAEKGASLAELKARFSGIDLETEIKSLQQLGFLVVGDEDNQLNERIYKRAQSMDDGEMVRCLRLNTTSGCNLACIYCHGVNEASSEGPRFMPIETALKSIRVYTDILLANKQKAMHIRYFGGEPLLNWSVVRDSLEYAVGLADQHKLSLSVLLNTNATLLTPEKMSELNDYKAYLQAIVSLDGPSNAHDAARIYINHSGSFEQTCRGLDLLQEANIPFHISVTMGAHNKDHLCELIDLLLKRKIYSMSIDPVRIVFEQSDPLTLADKLISAIDYGEKYGFHVSGMWEGVCKRLECGATGSYCGGSGSELSVLPTGEIYPCQSQPMRLGTLQDVETRELFTSDVYHRVTMRVVGNLPDCRGCEIEGMCVGGCAADAYAAEHDLYGRTRFCEFLRKMVRYHLEKLGEAARAESQAH